MCSLFSYFLKLWGVMVGLTGKRWSPPGRVLLRAEEKKPMFCSEKLGSGDRMMSIMCVTSKKKVVALRSIETTMDSLSQ